jgi:hypothetical protein
LPQPRSSAPSGLARSASAWRSSIEARILLDADQIGLPLLHSLPGASTAIYLNFNGWAAGGVSPYDEDGDPTTMSPTEQAHVTEAWRQVGDYFGMFTIDVTTEQSTVHATESLEAPVQARRPGRNALRSVQRCALCRTAVVGFANRTREMHGL